MVAAEAVTHELEQLLRRIAAELQLSVSLSSQAEDSYYELAAHLERSALASYAPALYAQGSWRIGTTVKPLVGEEFDLDLVVELSARLDGPCELFDLVAAAIEESPTYKDRTERKRRCVRIDFPGAFHMDVVPAVPNPGPSDTQIRIPDRTPTGWRWQTTDPKAYVWWFQSRAREVRGARAAEIEPLPQAVPIGDKSALQVAVQLLKRHHQLHVEEEVRTPSIVLTTMAGFASEGQGLGDLLNAAVAAVVAWGAPASPSHIENPANPGEILTEKWNEPSVFAEFSGWAQQLRRDWDALTQMTGGGTPAVAAHLTQMFGEFPVTRAVKSLGARTQQLADAGGIRTGAGGALSEVAPGRGNRPHTNFGDA